MGILACQRCQQELEEHLFSKLERAKLESPICRKCQAATRKDAERARLQQELEALTEQTGTCMECDSFEGKDLLLVTSSHPSVRITTKPKSRKALDSALTVGRFLCMACVGRIRTLGKERNLSSERKQSRKKARKAVRRVKELTDLKFKQSMCKQCGLLLLEEENAKQFILWPIVMASVEKKTDADQSGNREQVTDTSPVSPSSPARKRMRVRSVDPSLSADGHVAWNGQFVHSDKYEMYCIKCNACRLAE